jgi:hypothetical protein
MIQPSPLLVTGFIVLALALAAAFVWGVARTGGNARAAALGAAAWLSLTGGAAAAGWVHAQGRPPTLAVLLAAMAALAVWVARGSVGGRLAAGLPLAVLVGVQGFRLPLELLMHRAYEEGLMPVQMSYEGPNWDVLTGASALVVAALLAAGRMPKWGVWLWNAAGFALLLNIVAISILSTPIPIRVFHNEPANVWITAFPFVWLPTVMVMAALVGHLIIFRRLQAGD